MITYAQLQKVGFLDDDEEGNDENNQNAGTNVDQVECARQKMYNQIGNSLENMKYVHYVHNDLESNRTRRNYSIRRRQPFQLYKCDVCGSEFVHRTHLKIHQRTHTGEKPYKCNYCGRCFAQKGNLHVHMKIHTGEKDFICEYCQRGFITNAQLFVHMRTHTNPNRKRPYATGRPPKLEQSDGGKEHHQTGDGGDDGGSGGEETANQIIVQLVQPEDETHVSDPHGGCKSPVIPPTESRQLESISEEPGAAVHRKEEASRIVHTQQQQQTPPENDPASVFSLRQQVAHVREQHLHQPQHDQSQHSQHPPQQHAQHAHSLHMQLHQHHQSQQAAQQQHTTSPNMSRALQQSPGESHDHQVNATTSPQHDRHVTQPIRPIPQQPLPQVVQQQQQQQQSNQPNLHNLVVPDANLRGLAESGSEMIHILVAQQ